MRWENNLGVRSFWREDLRGEGGVLFMMRIRGEGVGLRGVVMMDERVKMGRKGDGNDEWFFFYVYIYIYCGLSCWR